MQVGSFAFYVLAVGCSTDGRMRVELWATEAGTDDYRLAIPLAKWFQYFFAKCAKVGYLFLIRFILDALF